MARPRLYLRDYRPGDHLRFAPRADMAEEAEAMAWNWLDGHPPGRCWTLVKHAGLFERVLGVGGLFDAGQGHWHAWAMTADLSPREWIVAGHLAADVLDSVGLFNAPASISALARTSVQGAQRLLEALDFTPGQTVGDPRVGEHATYVMMTRAA